MMISRYRIASICFITIIICFILAILSYIFLDGTIMNRSLNTILYVILFNSIFYTLFIIKYGTVKSSFDGFNVDIGSIVVDGYKYIYKNYKEDVDTIYKRLVSDKFVDYDKIDEYFLSYAKATHVCNGQTLSKYYKECIKNLNRSEKRIIKLHIQTFLLERFKYRKDLKDADVADLYYIICSCKPIIGNIIHSIMFTARLDELQDGIDDRFNRLDQIKAESDAILADATAHRISGTKALAEMTRLNKEIDELVAEIHRREHSIDILHSTICGIENTSNQT